MCKLLIAIELSVSIYSQSDIFIAATFSRVLGGIWKIVGIVITASTDSDDIYDKTKSCADYPSASNAKLLFYKMYQMLWQTDLIFLLNVYFSLQKFLSTPFAVDVVSTSTAKHNNVQIRFIFSSILFYQFSLAKTHFFVTTKSDTRSTASLRLLSILQASDRHCTAYSSEGKLLYNHLFMYLIC